PSEIMALNNASIIINKLLKGDNAIDNDPETFGIAGAIYKNMYLYNKDLSILDKAIKYYGAGFNIRKDYYNGENYALYLDIKASKLQGEEAIYNRMLAKKTREEIIEIINEILSKGIDDRDDIRWIYATLANCYYSIMENEKGDEYEEKFKKEVISEWELDTYYKNKEELLKLLYK
ncbi:MAG: TRAFs-binding domain-containing protein, partial [Intestinibacter sp.]